MTSTTTTTTIQYKHINSVRAYEIKRGDIVTQSPAGSFTYGGTFREAKVNEYLTAIDGTEYRCPIGTLYAIKREMTEAEAAERNDEMLAELARRVWRHAENPQAELDEVKAAACKRIMDSGRPASEVQWFADKLAKAEGAAECWYTVNAAASHLADGGEITTAHIIEATLIAIGEAIDAIMRGRGGSSSNPYSNAVDDDKLNGKRDWLRSMDVAGVKHFSDKKAGA